MTFYKLNKSSLIKKSEPGFFKFTVKALEPFSTPTRWKNLRNTYEIEFARQESHKTAIVTFLKAIALIGLSNSFFWP